MIFYRKGNYEVKKAVDEIFPSKNIEGTIWWVERIK